MFKKVFLITETKPLGGLLFRILNIVHYSMRFGVSAFLDELKQRRPVREVF